MMLVTQGREPRRLLTLKPSPGSRQLLLVTHSVSVTVETGGRSTRAPPMPGTRMAFLVTVESVSPEGDVRYGFTLDAVDLLVAPGTPQQIVEEVRSSLTFLPGLSGRGSTSHRGGNRLELELPAQVDSRLREQVARLVEALRFVGSPLPSQPVGVGACWEQPLYGSEGSGTARFELEALEGERATLGLLIQQTSRERPLSAERPARQDASELIQVRAQTTGRSSLRLDRLWPSRCELEMRLQADLSAPREDPPRRMRTLTEVTLSLVEEQPA